MSYRRRDTSAESAARFLAMRTYRALPSEPPMTDWRRRCLAAEESRRRAKIMFQENYAERQAIRDLLASILTRFAKPARRLLQEMRVEYPKMNDRYVYRLLQEFKRKEIAVQDECPPLYGGGPGWRLRIPR